MKRSSSEAKPSAKLVGAMSSSIADTCRTDAAVKLVSEFIIEDKVERSVLWGDWGERSVMAASMSSAVMALLGVVVDVGVWV